MRAIAAAAPARIVLLDSSEHNLFGIHSYMAARAAPPHEAILGSVTDASLLNSIFRRFRPNVVYHAAAFKHVSLLELNPFAAVRNNAIGTYTLARAALDHSTAAMVLVSTDKAVNPHSIMGASKRLAELTMAALAGPQCRMNAVRLANVVGSPGSVIPIFNQQIAYGGPVTVTHPDATRYFMSLDAAVDAILACGAAQGSGKILVPELGQPRRIVDLARSLIAAAGNAASNPIEIRFIGLRPGEKLHEDVRYPSETNPLPSELHTCMQQVARQLAHGSLAELIRAIRALVPEYVAA